MFDDELAEKFLWWEQISIELIKRAIRKWTITGELYPIMCGSALWNKWVQLVLDAVIDFLPSPLDRGEVVWIDPDDETKTITRKPDDNQPVCAIAFKIMTDPFVGTLTFVRIYSWIVKSGDTLLNPITWQKERVWRLLLMHANKREEISEVHAWNICAFLWLKDTRTWNTLCDMKQSIIMDKMVFPAPVIDIAIEPKSKADQEKMWIALSKLAYEDPSFKYYSDPDSNQTIIAGMGELHLEIIVDRLKREHKVEVSTGKPQVAYRETITQTANGEWIFKRQTWGRGQFGHVLLRLDRLEDKNYEFNDEVSWGTIPKEFIPAIDKGAKETIAQWILAGFPIINVKVSPYDGSYHDVDSSEIAFKIATYKAFKDAFMKAAPVILEPIMDVEIVTPEEYVWDVMWDLSSRRGMIQWQDKRWNAAVIKAKVPLAEMFGYTTDLRSNTQWRAQSSMTFSSYEKVPENVAQKIIAERSGKIKAMDAE
jgi:elongation factor G